MVLVFIQYKRRNERNPGIGLDSALVGQNSEKVNYMSLGALAVLSRSIPVDFLEQSIKISRIIESQLIGNFFNL